MALTHFYYTCSCTSINTHLYCHLCPYPYPYPINVLCAQSTILFVQWSENVVSDMLYHCPCLFLPFLLAGNQTSVHLLEREVASDTTYTVYHIRLICLLHYTPQYYCTQSTYIDSTYGFTYSKYLDDLTLFCTFVSLIFLRMYVVYMHSYIIYF